MSCPPGIASAVFDLLTYGLLCSRAAGWSGDADRAALEADHVHNLPGLLPHYSPDKLRYYWDFERPTYQGCLDSSGAGGWEPVWNALQAAMQTAAV